MTYSFSIGINVHLRLFTMDDQDIDSKASLQMNTELSLKLKNLEDSHEDQPPASVLRSLPAENGVSSEHDQDEFDFVERPSEDFFCPVTFELLLDPHQTTCCGNHLSLKAVNRLKRDSKPCPMCKEPELATVHDKFYGRKVSEVHVYCRNKSGGCDWKGEVNGLKQHIESCLKRQWKCQYCDFSSTMDEEMDHVMNCPHYPTACPNQCDVGTMPRRDIEEHLTICPLELVACEFMDVGCTVRSTRQDLKRHMEESQQEHLLSATLLNLRLTKETIAEKDRQLAEKDRLLAEKDKQVEELQKQVELLQASFDHVKVGVDRLLGGMRHCHEFTLSKISQWREWRSDMFYSHRGGYQLRLSVKKEKPSGFLFRGTTLSNMIVGLVLCKGDSDHLVTWPVTICADIQLLDQLKKEKHYSQSYEYFFMKSSDSDVQSEHVYFVSRSVLYPDGERSLYVVSDCIKVRLSVHMK